MGGTKDDITRLRETIHSALVEVEMAIDTATHPDWTDVKEALLRAVDIARRLERDQMWSKLSSKK